MNKGLWYFFLVLFFAVGVSVLYNEGQKTITGNAVIEIPKDSLGVPTSSVTKATAGDRHILWESKGQGGLVIDSCDETGSKLTKYSVAENPSGGSGYVIKSKEYTSASLGPGKCVYSDVIVILSRYSKVTKEDFAKLTLVRKESSKKYVYTARAGLWENDYSSSTGLEDAVAALQKQVEELKNIIKANFNLFQCNDKVDNDDDGLIDYPADTECSSATDNDERLVSDTV